MEDICDVMRVCTERCVSMSRFITLFADVVKIPEPTPVSYTHLSTVHFYMSDVVFNISNGNFIYVTVNFIFIFFHRFILRCV